MGLQTKLYIPQVRVADLLPRLIEQMNEGLHRMSDVTLISAPTGFGKITLVSEWLAAWLPLDNADNDPICFLTYLVAAL